MWFTLCHVRYASLDPQYEVARRQSEQHLADVLVARVRLAGVQRQHVDVAMVALEAVLDPNRRVSGGGYTVGASRV